MTLQVPWMFSRFWKIREVRSFLFVGRKQRNRRASRGHDRYTKRVALEPGVQVVVLRRSVVNPKAEAKNGSPANEGWRPGEAQSRIEVPVIRVVQRRIPRAWGSVDWSQKRSVEGT